MNELEAAQKAAERVLDCRARAAEADTALRRLEAAAPGAEPTRAQKLALRRAQLERENLRGEADAAEKEWAEFAARGHADMNRVLRDYPDRIAAQSAAAEAVRMRLKVLEERAFKKVAQFRRGLPRGLSAFPGVFPLPQDDWSSYTGRLRRLREGRAALAALKEARGAAETDIARVPGLLLRAEEILGPLADAAAQQERLEIVRIEEETLLAEHTELDQSLKELNIRRRQANRGAALALESDVRGLSRDLKRLDDRRADLRMARERCTREYDCARNIGALVGRIAELRAAVEQDGMDAAGLRRRINAMLPDFAAADISLRRYFIGELPWHIWARPLGRWALLIGLSYIALLALNVLIFRQWAHNEMITYPLAELPKALVYTARPEGGLPDVFRNGLFWMGLALSGAVLGWNLLCKSQVVPGLSPLNLLNGWSAYVVNTPLEVLMNWKSEVFFTMIGLASLSRKTFLALFFTPVSMMPQLLVMYWSGYRYPEGLSQWWYMANIKDLRRWRDKPAWYGKQVPALHSLRLNPGVLKDLPRRAAGIAFFLRASTALWESSRCLTLDMGANPFCHGVFLRGYPAHRDRHGAGGGRRAAGGENPSTCSIMSGPSAG